MKKNSLAWIGSYIWGIADDVLIIGEAAK